MHTPYPVAPKAARDYMVQMKVRDADILFVPGYDGSGPEHWQTRWQSRLSTGRRVEHRDWLSPDPSAWTGVFTEAANKADRPLVLVAHSLGVTTVLAALGDLRAKVAGAFLVAPPDILGSPVVPEPLRAFGEYSREPLPFPSMLIASRNDPYCSFEVAEDLGGAWGSLVIDAGDAGHINADAGYGPWPEGSLTFANFLTRL